MRVSTCLVKDIKSGTVSSLDFVLSLTLSLSLSRSFSPTVPAQDLAGQLSCKSVCVLDKQHFCCYAAVEGTLQESPHDTLRLP